MPCCRCPSLVRVLVLLPPSESKTPGGAGPPLDLAGLAFPELTDVRRRLVDALVTAANDEPAALRAALALGPTQDAEVQRCAQLRSAPTMPALGRYTGVLYAALGYDTLRAGARERADRSLLVASALFGLLRPADHVPAYRFSAGTSLPGLGRLPALWRPVLEPLLREREEHVVDLRSGAYAALARVPGATTVRVLRESGGRRTVVSHDNKSTKGLLARLLCEHGARTPEDVAALGERVADAAEVSARRVDLVLHGLASARR